MHWFFERERIEVGWVGWLRFCELVIRFEQHNMCHIYTHIYTESIRQKFFDQKRCRNSMLRIKLNKSLAIKLLLSNANDAERQWPQMVT